MSILKFTRCKLSYQHCSYMPGTMTVILLYPVLKMCGHTRQIPKNNLKQHKSILSKMTWIDSEPPCLVFTPLIYRLSSDSVFL